MGRTRLDDAIDALFDDEDEVGADADVETLKGVLADLAKTAENVSSTTMSRRVERLIATGQQAAMDSLAETMQSFLARQEQMLGSIVSASSATTAGAAHASSQDFRAALDEHTARLEEFSRLTAESNRVLAERVGQLEQAFNRPRRRTPVRDESGDILHVRDEPWT